ncbi:O-methyltransferase-domain-containing protein [Mycena pura]|uniref:O-methyltransferase-domain-containing protein n=1 Tax=Mycena pura TaxID=153505 RepID=A0AAD6UVU5_9AGAR|nr:O-methyltransferase-domain-containing protein [Mycena pura]
MSPVSENKASVIDTGFTELLQTIEQSAAALRIAAQTQQSDDIGASIAAQMGLPFHANAEMARQAAILRLASERLTQLVTPPRHVLFEAAGSFYATLCMKILVKADVASVIEDTNASGVAAGDLAKKVGMDKELMSRLLRHLASKGIFQEVSPGVWANTANSRAMAHAPEFVAHLDLVMYEGSLALPYWPQFMDARSSGIAPAPLSPFAMYAANQPFYQWIHSSAPAALGRGANFNAAMKGMARTEGVPFLPADYPFGAKFPAGTTVVDVGGGLGSLPALVLPAAPHLKFVVQDLDAVVKEAAARGACGEWVAKGLVEFVVHDCFSPQPERLCGGNVFVLKAILHNYPDSKASEILTHIRAANPSKLLIIDRVIFPQFPAHAAAEHQPDSDGTTLRDGAAPAQSLVVPTMYDLIMAALHGGRERLFPEWTALLETAGFSVGAIYPMRASTGQFVVECVPAELAR